MKDSRLSVELLAQQLSVVGGPVEDVSRLMVGQTRHSQQIVTTGRVVTHDERVRPVQRRGQYNSTITTSVVA